jgi:hypothetical protein
MKLFVAPAYSAYVNYETGEVFSDYKAWVENNLNRLESFGHIVFCALRADGYSINALDPASAFRLDERKIRWSEGLLAFVGAKPSEGIQTEIGMAIAQNKIVCLAHEPDVTLGYFNQAIIQAGQAREVLLPLETDPFKDHKH